MLNRFELINPKTLVPIEGHDSDRVEWLISKIESEGFWTVPVCVSTEGYVMDGHHRHQAALKLGLSHVPIERFRYEEVNLYSLRDEIEVEYELIKKNISDGVIYPYKTAKHDFPESRAEFQAVSLSELR